MTTGSRLFSWGLGRRADRARSASRASRQPDPGPILPPNIGDYGRRPFGEHELQALAQWLADEEWPRGTLSIAGLEGYLTALLLLPVASHPGTWLPPIWNDSGWRLAPPIGEPARFREFVELTCGFLRRIDADLSRDPAGFRSVCATPPPSLELSASGRCRDWVQGFGRALHRASHLHVPSSAPEYRALAAIASCASPDPAGSAPVSPFERLRQAVAVLAAGRSTGEHPGSPFSAPASSRSSGGRPIVRDEAPAPPRKAE